MLVTAASFAAELAVLSEVTSGAQGQGEIDGPCTSASGWRLRIDQPEEPWNAVSQCAI